MKMPLFITALFVSASLAAQNSAPKPCAQDPGYRQFDFWIGDWEVYRPDGQRAGTSHVALILDSCVILENWQSINGNYSGKSFNSFDRLKRQWQQNWVDDKGGGNDFHGTYADDKMTLITDPYQFSKDTIAIRRMTFFNLGSNQVRQLGEISKDNGKTWHVEYDLVYRRKQQR